MKTNLTKPLTYFILGPPRSGTTIVANLFNALEDGFCLGEPHWHYYSQEFGMTEKSSSEIADELLNVFNHRILYRQLRGATNSILGGYKETYRLGHALCEWLLQWHIEEVNFFLIILRDPILVHSSQRALGWTEWDTPQDHNATYRRLDQLARHKKAIVVVYEDFVKDPLGYLNERLPFQIEGPLVLKPTGHVFGDPFANRSTEIVETKREICLSEGEIRAHREGREIWQKYKQQKRNQ